MKWILGFVVACLLNFAQTAQAQQRVLLTATDSVNVFGDFYPAPGPPRAMILLFHQAGSNRREYAPIAPRLNRLGFDALAIDQRSGGDLFGGVNETAAHLGHEASYLQALPDLEAALAWARWRRPNEPVIAWGSSYSSALVFLLAAKHPGELAAILAFSPGEYLGTPDLVKSAASKLAIPIFVTSASDPDEIATAKAILAASLSQRKTQYVPTVGVHGSSTLRPDRDPQGIAANWRAVIQFLDFVALR